jgi:hypothetical protein
MSAVALSCNPSYSGGRDWEDQGLRPGCGVGRSAQHPILTNKKLGIVGQACHPSYSGGNR